MTLNKILEEIKENDLKGIQETVELSIQRKLTSDECEKFENDLSTIHGKLDVLRKLLEEFQGNSEKVKLEEIGNELHALTKKFLFNSK